jgi:hypothetical protein
MAVGTSGNQYKNAPVVGAMMAELIDACEKGLDHDKEPFQFKMKYTGRNPGCGFFLPQARDQLQLQLFGQRIKQSASALKDG